MARALTVGMQAAVVAKEIRPFLMFRANFDSGALNLWTGYGALLVDGITHTGSGDLITVSAIRETMALEAIGASFVVNGGPQELLSIAYNEDYQDRPISLYLGMFDADWAIISDPYLLFEGRMDVMILDDDNDKAQIELKAENVLIDLTKPLVFSYTPGDQALFYPGDTGFNLVTSLQDRELVM